jgi:hypothetical protein
VDEKPEKRVTPSTEDRKLIRDIRPEYGDAVYGSLLAGSVIVGTSPLVSPPTPRELVTLLLATGMVFWLAHGYAELVGDRMQGGLVDRAELLAVARRQWPLFQSALPPAAAAALLAMLGLTDVAVAWGALIVAVTGQVAWAAVAAARSGASHAVIAVSAIANLGLGLILIALKAGLHH